MTPQHREKRSEMMESNDYSKWIRYILIILMAEGYLVCFSISTSPLYGNYYGGDSAFFILVGKGMKYGYLPYRDFFDMKGPWLFVVEWIGQIISEGRFGAFIIQSINMSGAMIMFDKLIGIGRNNRKIYETALLLPIFGMAVFSVAGGNLTEELAFFPLSVCLYLGTVFVYYGECQHKPLHAGVYGFFFGFLALIRVTNAALICAIVFTIVIILITNRQWKNLLQNARAFVVGFMVAVLPMIVFFASKGLLHEMLSQVFLYGVQYTSFAGSGGSGLFLLFTGTYRAALFPIIIGLAVSLFSIIYNWKMTLLLWSSSIATLAAIALSGRNFEHYYALLVPVVALIINLLCVCVSDHNWGTKKGVAIVCFALFILSFYGICILDKEYVNYGKTVTQNNASDEAIEDVSSHITDDGTVYCWTQQPRWYMYADKFPCIKYCGWQTDQMNADPSIQEKFEKMFRYNPPEWLVLENGNNELPCFVTESRDKFYKEVYNNDYWILYNKKTDKKEDRL